MPQLEFQNTSIGQNNSFYYNCNVPPFVIRHSEKGQYVCGCSHPRHLTFLWLLLNFFSTSVKGQIPFNLHLALTFSIEVLSNGEFNLTNKTILRDSNFVNPENSKSVIIISENEVRKILYNRTEPIPFDTSTAWNLHLCKCIFDANSRRVFEEFKAELLWYFFCWKYKTSTKCTDKAINFSESIHSNLINISRRQWFSLFTINH